MGRFSKKAAPTTKAAGKRHTGPAVNIAMLGEADAGKSAVMAKYFNPDTVLEPRNFDNYWGSQMEPAPNQTVYNGVNVNFVEVMGSRGRMSNYYQMRTVLATADVAVHCISASGYSGPHKMDEITEWAGDAIRRVRGMMEDAATANKGMPIFCFVTMADTNPDLVVPEGFEHDGVRYFAVSSLTNKGVTEAVTAVLDAALLTETGKRLRAAPVVEGETTTTTPATTDLPAADKLSSTKTDKPHSLLGKLLKMFGVGSTDKATATPPATVKAAETVSQPVVVEQHEFAVSA